MLDMFEGEGAKRAPGDLNFGKRFLPENKAEADELAMKAGCVKELWTLSLDNISQG